MYSCVSMAVRAACNAEEAFVVLEQPSFAAALTEYAI